MNSKSLLIQPGRVSAHRGYGYVESVKLALPFTGKLRTMTRGDDATAARRVKPKDNTFRRFRRTAADDWPSDICCKRNYNSQPLGHLLRAIMYVRVAQNKTNRQTGQVQYIEWQIVNRRKYTYNWSYRVRLAMHRNPSIHQRTTDDATVAADLMAMR